MEFAIVAGVFFADVHHHIFVSKTPYLFLLGFISLRLRGLRWRDVGFTRPRSWVIAIGIGVLAGICMEAIELFLTQPLIARLTGKMPDLSDFADTAGNWKMLFFWLALIWLLGALGEEIVYRGYLMDRVAGLFRNTRAAWIISLLVVSVAFGGAHIDQGITGMIENVWNGLLLGALYLASGRNLSVPTIAHGVTDTIDLLLMYLHMYPGMK
jgi:uncharacterized protein